MDSTCSLLKKPEHNGMIGETMVYIKETVDMDFEEKTISSKTIYKGNITDYVVEEVQLPDGARATREIVRHSGAAAIIPFTDDGRMIFVKQFRKPIEKTILEIPAGKIDKTDASPEETAKRELEEETGFRAETFYFETSFYTSPGFADEILYFYVAEGLKKSEKPLQPDEDEFIELQLLTFEEAWLAYEEKQICDAKTIYALLFWKLKLASNDKER